MGVCFAAMVEDNEILGAIHKANVIPQVETETLALHAINEVAKGEGHFLGRPETYEGMRSDFLYPDLANRTSIEEWEADKRLDIAQKAEVRAKEILPTH